MDLLVSTPYTFTLNAGYKELHFRWQRSLHLIGILICHLLPSFLFNLNFFSRTALQFFLLTKWTIVVFFDLPIRWQSSISNVLILTLIWLKILITFSSNLSSGTLLGIPYMSRLLCLLYLSCLIKSVSNTETRISHFQSFNEVMNFLHGVLQGWYF